MSSQLELEDVFHDLGLDVIDVNVVTSRVAQLIAVPKDACLKPSLVTNVVRQHICDI